MTNRLIQSTSPYLLQHAHNPVDWNPWDGEALERSRGEDKPIFLSIGYSACHWCHVMERESFEDEAVAAELNAHFIPIKVDREERPDLDDLYMAAVQVLSGRGGWPMSVWLTPELKPFFGGTYFPPTPRHGLPGFLPLLESIRRAWGAKRGELEGNAAGLLEAMLPSREGGEIPGLDVIPRALDQLARSFDPRWGGFGSAPKFPQPPILALLLRRGGEEDRSRALATLEAMGNGGIYDHLGGGFARYSVDERWLVPHFEKMLYDNAQLASCYLEAFRLTGRGRFETIARETLDYLLEDLSDPGGGFHSSEDADSEGEEGRFYVFTPAEVEAILGPREGEACCLALGITPEGCFEGATSVLHRFEAPDRTLNPEWRRRLREYRATRVRPARDDKVLAAWNGLALGALASGYRILGEPRYREAAERLADFLHRELGGGGTLLRTWRRGRAHTPAFLEDYGAVILGLVDLYEAAFDPRWLIWARRLGDDLLEHFEDPDLGFFGSRVQADLLIRQKPLQDGVLPSGNALAARGLLALARHFDHAPFRRGAEGVLRTAAPLLDRVPAAFPALVDVLGDYLAPGPDLVIAGDPRDPATRALVQAAHRAPRPGALTLVEADPTLPLHRDRRRTSPTAFLCREGTCLPPLTDPGDLAAALRADNRTLDGARSPLRVPRDSPS